MKSDIKGIRNRRVSNRKHIVEYRATEYVLTRCVNDRLVYVSIRFPLWELPCRRLVARELRKLRVTLRQLVDAQSKGNTNGL